MAWFIVFCYIIMAFGISNMFVYGSGPFKIFERIRVFAYRINDHFGLLFSCMMCFPANFGIVMSLFSWFLSPIYLTPFTIILGNHSNLWWIAMLLDCGFTSGIVWFINNISEFFESFGADKGKEDNEENIINLQS